MHELLQPVFLKSFEDFLNVDSENIAFGVSERNLCARLAFYLQTHAHQEGLKDYFADPEYNKQQGGNIKTIINEREEVLEITCDLILHSRGQYFGPDDNLIAIEMKKDYRPADDKKKDRERLTALTKQTFDDVWSADGKTHPDRVCCYHVGYYTELVSSNRCFLIEEYIHGEMLREFSLTY